MAGFISAIILSASCSGCSNSNSVETRQRQRDKVENITDKIRELPMADLIIGPAGRINVTENHIFFTDANAADNYVNMISPFTLKHEGSFAKIGPGPEEIQSPGAVSMNDELGTVYIFDYGHWQVAAFNIDSALTVPDYKPWVKLKITSSAFPSHYAHINDSIGFAREISNWDLNNSYSQAICTFNLSTGEQRPFAEAERRPDNRSLVTPYAGADSIVVETCSNNDLMLIYDFNGNLLRKVKGPHYGNNPDKHTAYFNKSVVTPRYILASYSGGPRNTEYFGTKLHIFNHQGDYIKTFETGRTIIDFGFHEKTNRLFFVFNDEMQFGILDLDNMSLE